ncbi:MAG: serine hydrolase [Actinomycetota bacterium]|nr:serine hydrolase [Actinomycetota bacterium]
MSKSAMLNAATLRLAAKFGAGLLDERVADHVPAFRRPGWDDVTFLDLANMASGHGATPEDPACYLCDYDRWYLAPSRAEKLA